MRRCEQGALVMMVKSSLKLSVSEIEVEEVVACFNAQCVGYQSLWDEGENGYWGLGGGRCRRALFPPSPYQQIPPPMLRYLPCLLLPAVTSLTYKQPFYN